MTITITLSLADNELSERVTHGSMADVRAEKVDAPLLPKDDQCHPFGT
jgi:hypothetical protein